MSRLDQDSFTEPAFIPRSVAPQKFETPDEYLNFLKENELTQSTAAGINNTVRNEITEILNSNKTKPAITDIDSIQRRVYLWNFDGKSLDSVSNFPQIITRSKVLLSRYNHKTKTDHDFAIQLISRQKKCISKPKVIIGTDTQKVETKEKDDEDIFADAGRDYVLEVDESYQAESVQVVEEVEEEQVLDFTKDSVYFDSEQILNKGDVDMAVDTDMIDLDLEEIEYSNYQESSQPKKKLKLRADFESDEAFKSYQETQSLMFSSSRIPFEQDKKTRRGRGAHRGGARGSNRGSHKGKLDRELEAVDKVYQKKYGTGLNKD